MSKNLITFNTHEHEIIDLINAAFEQSKQVSRYESGLMKGYIQTILDLVDHINSLPYGENRVSEDYLLSEVELPSWVEPFVFPERVVIFLDDYFSFDLVERPARREEYKYDPLAVNRAAYMLAQTQKTKPVMKKASEMRKEQTINTVNFSVNGKVKYGVSELGIPVPINSAFARVYREEMDTLPDVNTWVRKWFVSKPDFKAE